MEAGLVNKTLLYADPPECGPDGNYEPVQSHNSKWICVDPSGNQLEDDENGSPYEVCKTGLTSDNMNCSKFVNY